MKTPPVETIRVGPVEYWLINWERHHAERANHYGEARHGVKEIWVDFAAPGRQAVCTLVHELLHCLNAVYDLRTSIGKERGVTALEAAWCALWRDNPELFAWMHKALTHD